MRLHNIYRCRTNLYEAETGHYVEIRQCEATNHFCLNAKIINNNGDQPSDKQLVIFSGSCKHPSEKSGVKRALHKTLQSWEVQHICEHFDEYAVPFDPNSHC